MDVFSDLIRDIVSKSKSSVVIEQKQESVVEFVESSWGLNYRLFPGQRFILKLFYDEPLDNTEKTIPIPDPFTGQVKEWYSEQGYLDHLFSSKRTNIKKIPINSGLKNASTHKALFKNTEDYFTLILFIVQWFTCVDNCTRVESL